MKKKYDIFISYRRSDAGDKAAHLNTLLEKDYKDRISFDLENISGLFKSVIINRIAGAKDFILVLGKRSFVYSDNPYDKITDKKSQAYKDAFSPETVRFYQELAECSDEECIRKISNLQQNGVQNQPIRLDYVRIEIGRALRRKKPINIIPVVPERTSQFNFSALELPPDIEAVKNYNAVFYSENPDYPFKDIVPKISSQLKSKKNNRLLQYSLAFVAILTLCFGFIFSTKYFNDKKAFESCHNYLDYYNYNAENHTFFADECKTVCTEFERLENRGVAFVNNTSSKAEKDSISVCWSEDITLCQLKTIVGELDSMMFVPRGKFTMGTNSPLDNEGPAHTVSLTEDFYIGKYEVSRNLWYAITADSTITGASARLPMTNITWEECIDFTERLGELTGLNFTLPTEAQWEYAAKGAGAHTEVAGEEPLDNIAWYKKTSMGRLHSTRECLSPNALELYNMQGNVEEWCYDSAYRPYTAENIENPVYISDNNKKVVRGGSYQTPIEDMTITFRDAAAKNMKSENRGFRLVITLNNHQ